MNRQFNKRNYNAYNNSGSTHFKLKNYIQAIYNNKGVYYNVLFYKELHTKSYRIARKLYEFVIFP